MEQAGSERAPVATSDNDPPAAGLDERFASDNCAGVHPEILEAIAEASTGYAASYGADPWTRRLEGVVRRAFGPKAAVYPVLNGTGANVVALHALVPRWGAVICAEGAHVNTDECGAPERVAGVKLLSVETTDGKLTEELIDRHAWGFGDEHRAQPAAVSITQATEVGTVYSATELRRIADHAHARGLRVHLDGSRLANAAASLDCELRELTTDVGVDVVSLGATKCGALCAEAVVVLEPEAAPGVEYLRKMDTQLASKMRLVSSQLLALYDGDLWRRCAGNANAMAARLAAGVEGLPGVTLTHPVQANAVFAIVEPAVVHELRSRYDICDWGRGGGEVRLMCSWSTTGEAVDDVVAAFAVASKGVLTAPR